MAQKKRILWLCTFTNSDKRKCLSLWRNTGGEIGQWIPNLIQGFVGNDQYELHVVSPEGWMRKGCQTWKTDDITYHSFQPGVPGIGYPFRLPFEALTRYWFNRRHVQRIIEKVQPDLIHLFGVENPQYGASLLNVGLRIPVVVTIQGFVHRELSFKTDYNARTRVRYEKELMCRFRHYMGDRDSEQVVRSFNPDIIWTPFYFPVNERLIRETGDEVKKYDILFAGALTRAKGFHDFLEVVRMLREKRPTLQAGIVGRPEAFPAARPFIEKHGLQKHVVWLGRFPDQRQLFQCYRQTRVYLTPTYNDAFASTIRECMLLGTPVVSYATGGVQYVNAYRDEHVVLVPQGDVGGMAQKSLALLVEPETRDALSARARSYGEKNFSLSHNLEVIKGVYGDVLSGRPSTENLSKC